MRARGGREGGRRLCDIHAIMLLLNTGACNGVNTSCETRHVGV